MISRVFLCFAAMVIIFLANYELHKVQEEKRDRESVVKVNRILVENFEQVEKILITVGRTIANENPALKLDVIHKIFVGFSGVQAANPIFSWTLFDWVDKDHMQVVSTMFGVNTKNPRDMSDRFYAPNRGVEQWSLIFSEPVVGVPSGVFVIPIGVQIDTPSYSRAGIVTAGINISKLRGVIERNIGESSRFLIVDKKSRVSIFGSDASEKSEKINLSDLSSNLSKKTIYSQVLEMDNKYPYTIIAGHDREQFWIDVISSSIVQILQIFIIVILARNFIADSAKRLPEAKSNRRF